MIASTTPAVKTPSPVVDGAPKIGIQPSTSCSAGSTVERRNGARTKIPQRPRITLGIAASSSTSGPITAPARPGSEQAQVDADRDARAAPRSRARSPSHDGAVDQHAQRRTRSRWPRPQTARGSRSRARGSRGRTSNRRARAGDDLVDDQPDQRDRDERRQDRQRSRAGGRRSARRGGVRARELSGGGRGAHGRQPNAAAPPRRPGPFTG